MKKLIVLLSCLSLTICTNAQKKNLRGFKAFLTATFLNKNVYKTKANLTVKKAYFLTTTTNDPRDYALVPNPNETVHPLQVTVTRKTVPGTPAIVAVPAAPPAPAVAAVAAVPPKTYITTVATDMFTGRVTTSLDSVIAAAPALTVTSEVVTSTTYTVAPQQYNNNNELYIRYKIVGEAGDYQYIKILPGCIFSGANDTSIIVDNNNTSQTKENFPKNYIFKVAKVAMTPNTNYLASSALIGKITTIPIRFRKQYWEPKNTVAEASLSLGYTFGWKYKIGNNPYHTSYLSTVIAGLGVSQQKHFFVGQDAMGKDTLSPKTDELAVTYLTFGVTYEFEKFNIGIFCGKDKMFGNLKNWAYQDKWWWGIGIGYELFK